MSQESDVFGPVSLKLSKSFSLRTPSMAAMHEDESPELTEVARTLDEDLEIHNVPLKIRKLVVKLCDIVTRRAARLTAAGIVGILKKIGRDGSGGGGGGVTTGRSRKDVKMRRTVVALEGELYSNYPMFRKYLMEAIVDILGEELAQYVVLKETKDGSGMGAAIVAAIVAASYSDVDSV